MTPTAVPLDVCTRARRIRRATRAVVVMACGLALLQACNGADATRPQPEPGVAGAVPVNIMVGSAVVGTALEAPVRLSVLRADGQPAAGTPVQWTANDGGQISATSSVTDARGIAVVDWTLGTQTGRQTLVAQVTGLAPVIFGADATPDRPAAVRFSTSEARTRLIGDTMRLSPLVVDRFGNATGTTPVLAVESASDVVGLTGNLLVARRRGVAVVRAAADTAVARLTVVVDPLQPSITRVSPDTLVPGGSFVIDGANFALVPEGAEVVVGALKATVTSASATQIRATLPAAGGACQPTADHSVTVTVAALSGQSHVALRSATRISLARGESANLLDLDQVRCAEIVAPAGGTRAKYVVAVINTSASAAATSSFELHGTGAGPMAGKVASPVTTTAGSFASVASGGTAVKPLPAALVAGQAAERTHDDFLDAQRAVRVRYGSPAPTWDAIRRTRAMSGVAGIRMAARAGDTVTMKALYSSCGRGTDIRARVVYAGARSVVLEDIAAARAGTMDAQYQALGEEFDRVQYPLLLAKIGDPLALDERMGGDGRVTMLFTKFVNDSLPGIAGYVTSCNLYPKGTVAASNEDEVFYARTASAGELPDDWRRGMRSTVIHEVKHLAAFAERFVSGAPFEESWLEESTARIAEELYSRTFAKGGAWKENQGFDAVRCEVLSCDGRPLMMWKHFSVLHQYYRGVDTLTPIGSAASGDFTFYASGWSLVRWAADHYAGDEGEWLKSLVKGGANTGLAALAARTGRSSGELLADWALANAVDDLPGFTPARPQLTFPSWNVSEVMSGLAASYPSTFVASPLKGRAMSFGSFVLPVARLRAFSSSYFSFEGAQAGSQLLELRGEGGGALPAGTLRVAVVRVE